MKSVTKYENMAGKETPTTHQELRMKRILVALMGASIFLGASACADPETSIIVTGHKPLEGTEEELEDGSVIVTDCQAPTTLTGGITFYNVFVNLSDPVTESFGFELGFLMENRLVDSSSYAPIGHDDNQRLDQNHIEVQGYEFNFDGGISVGGGDLRLESTGLLTTDGQLFSRVLLISPEDVNEWRASHSAASGGQDNAIVPTFIEAQVKGRTVGGDKVESNILTIPVEVCDGCNRPSTPICVAGN